MWQDEVEEICSNLMGGIDSYKINENIIYLQNKQSNSFLIVLFLMYGKFYNVFQSRCTIDTHSFAPLNKNW